MTSLANLGYEPVSLSVNYLPSGKQWKDLFSVVSKCVQAPSGDARLVSGLCECEVPWGTKHTACASRHLQTFHCHNKQVTVLCIPKRSLHWLFHIFIWLSIPPHDPPKARILLNTNTAILLLYVPTLPSLAIINWQSTVFVVLPFLNIFLMAKSIPLVS